MECWNFIAEEKLFQHNIKCETEKKKKPKQHGPPKKKTSQTQPKPIHTTNKTKSLLLTEIVSKCFVKLEMENKSTITTKTVAACQNGFELPIAILIRTAKMNHVTYPISSSVFFRNFGVM